MPLQERKLFECPRTKVLLLAANLSGKGGKTRRRGKNEGESDKRELVFKEDGFGTLLLIS